MRFLKEPNFEEDNISATCCNFFLVCVIVIETERERERIMFVRDSSDDVVFN
jgi:hypothetical protein